MVDEYVSNGYLVEVEFEWCSYADKIAFKDSSFHEFFFILAEEEEKKIKSLFLIICWIFNWIAKYFFC